MPAVAMNAFRQFILAGLAGAEVTFFYCACYMRTAGRMLFNVFKFFRFQFKLCIPVKNPCGVGAGNHTKPAADTTIIINSNNTVGEFESCANRAHFYAGRVIAMKAGSRHPIRSSVFGILHFVYLDIASLLRQVMHF